jgi:hypothetical protein
VNNLPASSSPSNLAYTFPGHRRILLGHQSVGLDLLNGIRLLSPATKITDLTSESSIVDGAGIYHALIGRNGDPYSKIDDFARYVTSIGSKCDIVMMKLCYVDVTRDTDIRELFEYYRAAVEDLAKVAAETRLVHVTVPLRSVRLGLRSRIRMLAGHTIEAVEDNIQRDAYNALLASEYGGSGHFFDLAALEATSPNGLTSALRYKKMPVRMLYPKYTRDGGHLNVEGRKAIASEFIKLIDGL